MNTSVKDSGDAVYVLLPAETSTERGSGAPLCTAVPATADPGKDDPVKVRGEIVVKSGAVSDDDYRPVLAGMAYLGGLLGALIIGWLNPGNAYIRQHVLYAVFLHVTFIVIRVFLMFGLGGYEARSCMPPLALLQLIVGGIFTATACQRAKEKTPANKDEC